ncbi:hypothetical protein B0I35DRAFT_198537 [Stachybotrys elegans]|uniref:Tyrosinase copper-binding domain-containing protein n=1 Tax=Stachybotrys elegans TaxID=80388 RepID=A0A8K0SXK6_9HYPO|nr:hypothetical protein B0I35DRAFT_198537 [Stachybotrys elegans]
MQLPYILAALCLAVPSTAAPQSTAGVKDAASFLAHLTEEAASSLKPRHGSGESKSLPGKGCTLSNARIRRDWERISKKERKEYIKAVKCLQSLPAKSNPSFAPGARTRYDDFVATHINQTLSIHGTANFLTWHRYFTWTYEKALQEECGYTGTQPYWNWFTYTDDLRKSPVFDGSATSMSGDGEFFAHNGSISGQNNIYLPSGNGGGCVTSGPFKDQVVNLGPPSPGMDGLPAVVGDPLAHNPRCLRRDLSNYTAGTWMTLANLYNITLGDASHSIAQFQNELQGRFGDGFLGMHAAGHFAIGGESSDFFSSPNEPVFYLHHAMVDMVYWLWQITHPQQANDIAGTITIFNTPPSREGLKTDTLMVGVDSPLITIGDALDTMSGSPFCYIYL